MSNYNNYYPQPQEYYQRKRREFQGNSPRYGRRKAKTSQAKLHTPYGGDKGVFIYGNKISKGVRWSFKIFRSRKQQEVAPTVSGTGKEWVSVTMVLSAPMKKDVVTYGMLNIHNHKCYFKSWNWIVNPSANNGGYAGKHISKNRR